MIDNLRKRYEQLQGLLNTPANQSGGLLGNISQGALLGSAIYGQGIQGKDPFAALFPAVAQTAQMQQLLTPKQKDRKMVKGADGFNYYADTGERVLPNVKAKPPKPEDLNKIKRDQTKNLQGLFTNNAIVKDFNMASTQFSKLTSSAKQESAAGDMSMIFTYMKILDPTSVVREGEQATAASAGGVPDRVWNAYNKAVSGEKLTEKQRADFVSTASKLYNSNIKQFDAFKGSFGSSIQEFGLDPSQVFLSGDLRPKQIKTKDGEVIDSSKAQLLDYDMATGEMIYILPDGMKFRIKK
jgi:hypothetical protein